MLTENRKRQHSADDDHNGQLVPQAKRQNTAHPLSPEPGRDACDSESSSESSGISCLEHEVRSCSSQCATDTVGCHRVPGPSSPFSSAVSSELAGRTNLVSYHQINRILREAHFQSLQMRCQLRDT